MSTQCQHTNNASKSTHQHIHQSSPSQKPPLLLVRWPGLWLCCCVDVCRYVQVLTLCSHLLCWLVMCAGVLRCWHFVDIHCVETHLLPREHWYKVHSRPIFMPFSEAKLCCVCGTHSLAQTFRDSFSHTCHDFLERERKRTTVWISSHLQEHERMSTFSKTCSPSPGPRISKTSFTQGSSLSIFATISFTNSAWISSCFCSLKSSSNSSVCHGST